MRRARAVGDKAALRKLLTTHAIFQSHLHNLPQAFETFSEALDLSSETQEPLHLFIHWHNISAALVYAELPRLAESAARAALEYASQISCSRVRQTARGLGLSNLAYACLFTKAYGLGLRSSRLALELLDCEKTSGASPSNVDLANLVLALTIHARLLLRVNMLEEAERCLAKAKALSTRASSPKLTTLVVEMSCALMDTYCGNFDRGVSRLLEFVLSEETPSPVLIADAHRDLVEAYLAANRPQFAAEQVRQLGRYMQQVRSEVALFHHRRHLGWLASIGEHSVPPVERDPFTRSRGETSLTNERSVVLEDLCAAAELHDDPSGMHSHRVAELARLLAFRAGIGKSESDRVAFAARLHDVGKIGIPPAILSKPGNLDLGEAEIVRSHATAGAELLALATIDDMAIAVARHHHEWWSGRGYPDGLAKDEIPIAARITALCEAFDAMTHDRPYRPRRTVASALDVIAESAGRQFDPDLSVTFCILVRDLQEAHGDLDNHLQGSAKRSGFLMAKERFSQHIASLGV
ncbi:MAG TPA: HD domain-containing phosphohydrolase [Burkholderiaceae bacterium]|nr:HD domain-containing phosphohydrolase [Burkholderiaceae bacterium]